MTEARLCGEFLKSNWNFGELVFEGEYSGRIHERERRLKLRTSSPSYKGVQIIASGKDGSFCKAGGQKTIGAAKGKWEGVGECIAREQKWKSWIWRRDRL